MTLKLTQFQLSFISRIQRDINHKGYYQHNKYSILRDFSPLPSKTINKEIEWLISNEIISRRIDKSYINGRYITKIYFSINPTY